MADFYVVKTRGDGFGNSYQPRERIGGPFQRVSEAVAMLEGTLDSYSTQQSGRYLWWIEEGVDHNELVVEQLTSN